MSVGGARRAGPRPPHHRRRLRVVRLRGHAGDRDRPAHDPRLLAVRHRRGLRQGPREHQDLRGSAHDLRRGRQPRRQPDPGRSINTSIVALLPVAAILYVGSPARRRHAEGPRARAVRRHGRRHLLVDLHRDAAAGAPEARRDGHQQPRSRAKARARHDADRYATVPVVHRRHAVAGRDRTPTRRTPRAEDDDRAGPARRHRAGPRPPAAAASYPSRAARSAPHRAPERQQPSGSRGPSEARSERPA